MMSIRGNCYLKLYLIARDEFFLDLRLEDGNLPVHSRNEQQDEDGLVVAPS